MDVLLTWGLGLAALYWIGKWAVRKRDGLRKVGISLGCFASFVATALLFLAPDPELGTGARFLASAFVGAITGLIVAWGSWILLPILALVYEHTLGPIVGLVATAVMGWNAARQGARNRRAASRQRMMERNSSQDRMGTTTAAEVARQKRQQVRFICQLDYDQHARELEPVFPRQQLLEYFGSYLSDALPVEVVETNAGKLQDLIQRHLTRLGVTAVPRSLVQIQGWYDQQRQQIEALADEPLKNRLLVQLRTRFAELSTELLESPTS